MEPVPRRYQTSLRPVCLTVSDKVPFPEPLGCSPSPTAAPKVDMVCACAVTLSPDGAPKAAISPVPAPDPRRGSATEAREASSCACCCGLHIETFTSRMQDCTLLAPLSRGSRCWLSLTFICRVHQTSRCPSVLMTVAAWRVDCFGIENPPGAPFWWGPRCESVNWCEALLGRPRPTSLGGPYPYCIHALFAPSCSAVWPESQGIMGFLSTAISETAELS